METRLAFISKSIAYLKFSYLLRIRRLIYHITFQESIYKMKSEGIIEWFFDFAFYIFDLILLPEVYESIVSLTKAQYRFLNQNEMQLVREYFGDSVRLDFVRINSRMSRHIEKKAHAYVTLNTINFRNRISEPIFLHEMVHIWQYQRFGSMYIYRALKAQRTAMNYDYGGLENLYSGMIGQQEYINFNFEQQGSIIEDYCRLRKTEEINPIVKACYEYYLDQLNYHHN